MRTETLDAQDALAHDEERERSPRRLERPRSSGIEVRRREAGVEVARIGVGHHALPYDSPVTQRTIVLVVPPARRAAMRAALAAGPFEFRPVPHAVFSAKGDGAVATLYDSGKFVVQAAEPEAFVARWFQLDGDASAARASGVAERGTSKRATTLPGKTHEDPDDSDVDEASSAVGASTFDEPVIGSDEVGKGDYFGPLVVCAVRLEPGQSDEIKRSGVRDSKTLTDDQCLRLGAALRTRYRVAVERLDPRDYNKTYVQGRLNDLLADLHAKAIARLAEPGVRVVVDRFANERLLVTRTKKLGIRLEQRVRAESEPAVAAASVVAREEFLVALKELSEEAAVELRKGAGPPVDQAARRYVALHGFDALANVAKMHFKNTQKLGSARGGSW